MRAGENKIVFTKEEAEKGREKIKLFQSNLSKMPTEHLSRPFFVVVVARLPRRPCSVRGGHYIKLLGRYRPSCRSKTPPRCSLHSSLIRF